MMLCLEFLQNDQDPYSAPKSPNAICRKLVFTEKKPGYSCVSFPVCFFHSSLFKALFTTQILHLLPLHPFRGVFSLAIQNLHIESLGLRSLRSVSGGLVLIYNNTQLCYTNSVPWQNLLHPTQGPHRIVSHNQDPAVCGK